MPRAPITRNRPRRGRRRSRTRLVVIVIIVCFVTAPLVAIALSGSASPARGGSSATTAPAATGPPATAPAATSPATTAPATTAPATTVPAGPPTPTDIAAARACATFSTYLDNASQGTVPKAVGQALTNDAYQLIVGASQDQATGKPLPKWTNLGEYLLAAADDVVNRDTAALSTDGAAAAQACQSIPGPARAAGGYAPTPSPTSTSPSTPSAK